MLAAHKAKPREANCGVVVCGAGAAGIAAALAAARQGADVALLDEASRIGGTVTHALIHTLAGLFDSSGELINGGLPQELIDRLKVADCRTGRRQMGRTWVLSVCPNTYQRVVERWIAEEPNITVLSRSRVVSATLAARKIVELEAETTSGRLRLAPRAVLDATGTAEVVRLASPSLVREESCRPAGGWIFRIRGVEPGALAFPQGLGIVRSLRHAAAEGSLPDECGKAWIDTGLSDDEAYVKLFVRLPDDWRQKSEQISRHARSMQDAVVAFLRRLPQMNRIEVAQAGTLGVREGGRICGERTLTRQDVLEARRFADAICRSAWPIEYWHPEKGVSLQYLPEKSYYEIPMSALKVKGLANVWGAGKCLSADRYAQASARVVGTCWAMGEAAGKAAARLAADSLSCARIGGTRRRRYSGIQRTGQPGFRQRRIAPGNVERTAMTTNMYDLFHETAQRQPNHSAVLGPLAGATLIYRQLDEAIVSASNQLKDAGVHPGACVGLHFPSSRDYIIWNYAIWRCGGCVVPIPTELAPDEKREICRQIAVTHLLSQQKGPVFAKEFQASSPTKLASGADLMRLTSPQTHPVGFAALNAAFIRFTSGTTGASKGVVLSHESIQERIGAANTALQIGPADRIVWVLSMSYHFTVSIVAYLTFGATIVLPANHFAQALLAATEASEATILYASPLHYALLADAPLGGSLSDLRLAISTTSTLDAKVASNFERRYARPISQALGIIEIGLPAINCTGSRPESVGPVLPAYELRLEDAGLGSELQEVLLRGPGFLDAYYRPWQTRSQIMPDGWFHTGDVGHLDSEGRLCLRGRLKDVISVMGMKFFPQEVERVLAGHPEVAGACVFARSHERLGEAPHAKVVARNGADRGKLAIELRKYCRERLASYKVPEQIEFVPALPRTASGKVLHRLT